jgi:hypothetical protein
MMFELPILSVSTYEGSSLPQPFSEFVASFGLLATITGYTRQ